MPFLILQCAVLPTRLEITVLHQDDGIRRGHFGYMASNKWTIKSSSVPELGKNMLYVRGSETYRDLEVAYRNYKDNHERDVALNSIMVAVSELALHYKMAGNPHPPSALPLRPGCVTIVG